MKVKMYTLMGMLSLATYVIAHDGASAEANKQVQQSAAVVASTETAQLSPEERKLLLRIVHNKQIDEAARRQELAPSKLKRYMVNGSLFMMGLILGICSETAIELNYPFEHNHPYKRLLLRFLSDVGTSLISLPVLLKLKEYGYPMSAAFALGTSLAMASGVARTYELRKSFKRTGWSEYVTSQNLCEDITGGFVGVRISQLITDLWQAES